MKYIELYNKNNLLIINTIEIVLKLTENESFKDECYKILNVKTDTEVIEILTELLMEKSKRKF